MVDLVFVALALRNFDGHVELHASARADQVRRWAGSMRPWTLVEPVPWRRLDRFGRRMGPERQESSLITLAGITWSSAAVRLSPTEPAARHGWSPGDCPGWHYLRLHHPVRVRFLWPDTAAPVPAE